MARYIDADELRARVKAKTNPYGKPTLEYASGVKVLKMIDEQPTVEVVPNSDVEELIYKLECLLCHATGGLLSKHTYDLRTMESVVTDYVNEAYCDGHAEAKQEVAREIFAEIDSIIFGTIIPNDCAIISIASLAELKKKYTEAKSDE